MSKCTCCFPCGGTTSGCPTAPMQRVSILKEVNVSYSTGTVNLFAAGEGVGKSTLPDSDGWIACVDQLPPDETEVLIMHKGKRRIGALEWDIAGVEDSYKSYKYWADPDDMGDAYEWDDVTHWQHLPKAKVITE